MPYKDKEQQKEYQRQWVANRRNEFFTDKVCVFCGSTDRLELDHIDRSLKVSNRIWSWSQARREEELAKCQVLCYSCHKTKTLEVDLPDYWGYVYKHGTRAMYQNHSCRCEECNAWNAIKSQNFRNKNKPA